MEWRTKIALVRKIHWGWIGLWVAVLLVWLIYLFSQIYAFSAVSTLHHATAEQIAAIGPTEGYYEVSGGRMAYEWTVGDSYTSGSITNRTTEFISYVPFEIPGNPNRLVMLVQMSGEGASPDVLYKLYKDKSLSTWRGTMHPLSIADPKVIAQFADRHRYNVPPETPVLVAYDNPDPAAMRNRIIVATVLALLVSAVPFAVMFLKPKPKRRRPSNVPTWRK